MSDDEDHTRMDKIEQRSIKIEQQLEVLLEMLPKFGDFMREMGETEKARLLASLGSLGTPQERRNVRLSGESSIHGGLYTDTRKDMFKEVKDMLKKAPTST